MEVGFEHMILVSEESKRIRRIRDALDQATIFIYNKNY
jgi:hypothetical protein